MFNKASRIYKYEKKEIRLMMAVMKFSRYGIGAIRENPKEFLDGLDCFAKVAERVGEYELAEYCYSRSLEIRENVYGENYLDIAVRYSKLGSIIFRLGNDQKALSNLFKAYTILYYKFGLEDPTAKDMYKNIKLLYSEWNPEGNFEQWLEEKMKESQVD